jgi:hypothetical protein
MCVYVLFCSMFEAMFMRVLRPGSGSGGHLLYYITEMTQHNATRPASRELANHRISVEYCFVQNTLIKLVTMRHGDHLYQAKAPSATKHSEVPVATHILHRVATMHAR